MPDQTAPLPRSHGSRLAAGLATGVALAALMLMPLATAAQTETRTETQTETRTETRMEAQTEAATDLPDGFAAFDSDGDGVISPDEWAEGLESLPPRLRAALGAADDRLERRAAAMIRLFDSDGDGLLSAEELVSGMAALRDLRGGMSPAMQPGPRQRMQGQPGPRSGAARPDRPRDASRWQDGTRPRDGSGWQDRNRLGDDPRQRARDALRSDRFGPAGMAEAFERIDSDGDGVITREEWDAALERWTNRRPDGAQRGTPRRSE